MRVHCDAAHMIMRGRRHRNRLFRRVDAGGDAAGMDGGEFFGEMRAECGGGIEEGAVAGGNFREYAARHNIAGREFGKRMQPQHETLALDVDQGRAFTAQRFGGQRRRIAADHDRGRMKLHEFRIGDHGAGARGDRKPEPAGLGRICRHRIEMPDAAGRQHHRARRNDDRFGGGVGNLPQLQSGNRAILGQQRFGEVAFDHPDRRRVAHCFDQRGDDRLAGHVATHMHDAPRGMRGFPADRELALEVAIERNTVMQEVADTVAGFARQSQRHRLIDQAGADRDRIGGVRLRAVAFGNRRGNAALRPRCRGAFAQSCRGNHRNATRRQFQRAEQSGETAADNDDIVGVAGEVVFECVTHGTIFRCSSSRFRRDDGACFTQFFRLIIRSTERRAFPAMTGSMVTSSRR